MKMSLFDLAALGNRDYDRRYLGYFDCFNRQHYFEAHEVLEALWLPQAAR